MFFVKLSFAVLGIALACSLAQAQVVTSFSYQGRLDDGGAPANGQFDFIFKLYQLSQGGTQIGADFPRNDVAVTNGVFSTIMAFGLDPFISMTGFYVEVWVRPGASTGAYTPLMPRIALQTTPYSLKSLDTQLLGGLPSSEFVQNTDVRLSDARSPLPNSPNYIQNSLSQQPGNFNISGNGTVGGILSARLNATETNGSLVAIRAQNLAATGTENVAIVGQSENAVGFGTGGKFFGGSAGVSGVGNGLTSTATTYGVVGNTYGSAGTRVGVGGFSTASSGVNLGYGLLGIASGSAQTNFGVFGRAVDGTTNWAGYFDGNTYINGNLGIGTSIPTFKLQVTDSSNTGLRVQNNTAGGTVASFGSNGAFQIDSPNVPGGRFRVAENGDVFIGREFEGGNLTIYGNSLINTVTIANTARLNSLGIGGSTTLCRNASNQISTCSSSLRYKTNIAPFSDGLSFINKLRPITFDWKTGGMQDIGFGAEDVAKINPLFVSYNEKGEVEGVKYDRVGVVLVNAVKEQQQQIGEQQKQLNEQKEIITRQAERLERQQAELDALKRLICTQNSTAEICQPKNKF